MLTAQLSNARRRPRRAHRFGLYLCSLGAAAGLLSGCGAKSELLGAEPLKNVDFLPECTVEGSHRPCESICGTGQEECVGGEWKNCSAERPKAPKLTAVVRDLSDAHPDFEQPESASILDRDIVEDELGPDDKPVYAGMPATRTTTGKDAFETWFHDSLDSFRLETTIQLVPDVMDPRVFAYKSSAFFPIDGQGFGNEGRRHNYHFTLEAATAFRYVGGEVFSFSGDDDLWIFINRRLAIDLGGHHNELSDSVNLDKSAERLGLTVGETYSLHLFFAERHTIDSNFNIRTTIAEFELCE